MRILLRSIYYEHKDRSLFFKGINLSVANGEKAAITGYNGTGKSTLLRMIAGKLLPSSGELIVKGKLWYVPQHSGEYDNQSVAEVLNADKKLAALRAISDGAADQIFFDDLGDDWDIEDRLHSSLAEWDLKYLNADQCLGELSGGEKTKIFLAGISIHKPSILLLDEPTNHLDATGRQQLEQMIVGCKSTVLLVSHDHSLLNVMDKTIELTPSGLEVFGGNYDFYRDQKGKKVSSLQTQLEEQTRVLKQTQQKAREITEQRQKKESRGKAFGQSNSLPRIIAGGLQSKAERSTAKALGTQQDKQFVTRENIQQLRSQIQQYEVLKIDIRPSDLHKGKVLVKAENVNYYFGERDLWKPLNFLLRSGDRVQVTGKNGSGKTTLIKIITGELKPMQGDIQLNDFSFLYLDQDYSMLNSDLTVYEQIMFYNLRSLEEHQLKSLLTHAQFLKSSWDKKTGMLSGGEKMKLALSCLGVMESAPDMLILDESTNNLDIHSLEIFTRAIKHFEGTLIVVSHDAYFIEQININQQLLL